PRGGEPGRRPRNAPPGPSLSSWPRNSLPPDGPATSGPRASRRRRRDLPAPGDGILAGAGGGGAAPARLAHVLVVVLERHVDERLPARDPLAHRPRHRSRPQHHAAIVFVQLLREPLGDPGALVGVQLARDRIDVLGRRYVTKRVDGSLR